MLSNIFNHDNKTAFYFNQKSLLDLLEVICEEQKIEACLPWIARQKAYFCNQTEKPRKQHQIEQYEEIRSLIQSSEEPIKSYAICLAFLTMFPFSDDRYFNRLLQRAPDNTNAPLAYVKALELFNPLDNGFSRRTLLATTYDGETPDQIKARQEKEEEKHEEMVRLIKADMRKSAMPAFIFSAQTFLPAQLKLAMIYENGLPDVVEKNVTLACEYYEKALKNPQLSRYQETTVTEEIIIKAPREMTDSCDIIFFELPQTQERVITAETISNDLKAKLATLKTQLDPRVSTQGLFATSSTQTESSQKSVTAATLTK